MSEPARPPPPKAYTPSRPKDGEVNSLPVSMEPPVPPRPPPEAIPSGEPNGGDQSKTSPPKPSRKARGTGPPPPPVPYGKKSDQTPVEGKSPTDSLPPKRHAPPPKRPAGGPVRPSHPPVASLPSTKPHPPKSTRDITIVSAQPMTSDVIPHPNVPPSKTTSQPSSVKPRPLPPKHGPPPPKPSKAPPPPISAMKEKPPQPKPYGPATPTSEKAPPSTLPMKERPPPPKPYSQTTPTSEKVPPISPVKEKPPPPKPYTQTTPTPEEAPPKPSNQTTPTSEEAPPKQPEIITPNTETPPTETTPTPDPIPLEETIDSRNDPPPPSYPAPPPPPENKEVYPPEPTSPAPPVPMERVKKPSVTHNVTPNVTESSSNTLDAIISGAPVPPSSSDTVTKPKPLPSTKKPSIKKPPPPPTASGKAKPRKTFGNASPALKRQHDDVNREDETPATVSTAGSTETSAEATPTIVTPPTRKPPPPRKPSTDSKPVSPTQKAPSPSSPPKEDVPSNTEPKGQVENHVVKTTPPLKKAPPPPVKKPETEPIMDVAGDTEVTQRKAAPKAPPPRKGPPRKIVDNEATKKDDTKSSPQSSPPMTQVDSSKPKQPPPVRIVKTPPSVRSNSMSKPHPPASDKAVSNASTEENRTSPSIETKSGPKRSAPPKPGPPRDSAPPKPGPPKAAPRGNAPPKPGPPKPGPPRPKDGPPPSKPGPPKPGPPRPEPRTSGPKKPLPQGGPPVPRNRRTTNPEDGPPPLPPRPTPGHPLYRYVCSEPHGIAINNREAEEADELSYMEGDVIEFIEKIDDYWFWARNADNEGAEGLIINTDMKIIKRLPGEDKIAGFDDGPCAVAISTFESIEPGDLGFKEGDLIMLISRIGDGQWLRGRTMNGNEGIFPKSFVEVVEDLPADAVEESAPADAQPNETNIPVDGPYCIAVETFEGETPDDLPFKVGDLIVLTERIDDSWLRGTVGGNTGMFPQVFVDVKVDIPVGVVKSDVKNVAESIESIALYEFEGQTPDELTFKIGDKITVTHRVNDEWVYGSTGGSNGMFPAAFVDQIPDNLPMKEEKSEANDLPKASSQEPTVTIDTNVTSEQTTGQCKASFDFEAENAGELSFSIGEVITTIEWIGDEWLMGRIDDREGMFPLAFVDVIVELPKVQKVAKEATKKTSSKGTSDDLLPKGVARSGYEPRDSSEIAIKEGDEVYLLSRESSRMYMGENIRTGNIGNFPINIIEVITPLP